MCVCGGTAGRRGAVVEGWIARACSEESEGRPERWMRLVAGRC